MLDGPAGALVNARQPPTRLVESLNPISITQPVPGIYVATFERVVAGWAKITATGPAKTLITIHFGEKLNPDGTVIYLGTSFVQLGIPTTLTPLQMWPIILQTTGRQTDFGSRVPEPLRLLNPNFLTRVDLSNCYSAYIHITLEGFLYVQIEGWPGSGPPTTDDIVGQVVHDDFETYGDFASSSDLFNKLHAAVRYTMLNNVHSFPTDCPTFEKKGW